MIKKIPRTGLIQRASPVIDYISIRAYMNEGVNYSVDNSVFTHWMPLYFGDFPYNFTTKVNGKTVTEKRSMKKRFIMTCEKAISMICRNTTKQFEPEMVLNVFPQILLSLGGEIVREQQHPSIRIMRLFCHFHAMWLLFMQRYPQLNDMVEKRLQDFMSSPERRHKKHAANLGEIICFLMVSEKTTLK
jgi:hypothetical protein